MIKYSYSFDKCSFRGEYSSIPEVINEVKGSEEPMLYINEMELDKDRKLGGINIYTIKKAFTFELKGGRYEKCR